MVSRAGWVGVVVGWMLMDEDRWIVRSCAILRATEPGMCLTREEDRRYTLPPIFDPPLTCIFVWRVALGRPDRWL